MVDGPSPEMLGLLSSVRLRELVKLLMLKDQQSQQQIQELVMVASLLLAKTEDKTITIEHGDVMILSGLQFKIELLPDFIHPDKPKRKYSLETVTKDEKEKTDGSGTGSESGAGQPAEGDGNAPGSGGAAPN